ncbi:MAG TPA: hypothetical protein P5244_02520 [Syntrophales bacterium]|mgnify:CR=1 FL=1|nr:hypothetical protein [Syntrophales bacterium]
MRITRITKAEVRRNKCALPVLVSRQHSTSPLFTAFGLPEPVCEYRFRNDRRWRVDYCWPTAKLAVEIEGGAFLYGRHNRPTSYIKDIEKYNALSLDGYHLLRFTPQQLITGEAQNTILAWFRIHAPAGISKGKDCGGENGIHRQ